MARSRRLGIAGEVSAGPDPEVHKKSAGVTQTFHDPVFFRIPFFLQEFGRAFSLLEKRVVVDFPIRSYWNSEQ